MKAGDYTTLAADYGTNRPGYSGTVLRALLAYTGACGPSFDVADVGAGTGIWTRMLASHGLRCTGVEPNEAMRREAILHSAHTAIHWRAGSAEATGLDAASVDWVTMASSFHWVRVADALEEFHRILRPGGYLTVLWNPRDIEASGLEQRVEAVIAEMVPGLTRLSSGSAKHARNYEHELVSTKRFGDVVFFEARHIAAMTKERYLGVWRSVNDVQRQAGAERFQEVLKVVADLIAPLDTVVVPYRTRAWTARRL